MNSVIQSWTQGRWYRSGRRRAVTRARAWSCAAESGDKKMPPAPMEAPRQSATLKSQALQWNPDPAPAAAPPARDKARYFHPERRLRQYQACRVERLHRQALNQSITITYESAGGLLQAQDPRHLIEQPMLGTCCAGPRPVSATSTMASNNSRSSSLVAGARPLASRRPRYCNPRSLL